MNISESQCVNCPAKKSCADEPQTMPDKAKTVRVDTCPPQTRTVNLYRRLDRNIPSAIHIDEENILSYTQTPKGEVSLIKQETKKYQCSLSEKRLFIDPLEKRINSRDSSHFNPNSGLASSTRTPIQDYNHERYSGRTRRS